MCVSVCALSSCLLTVSGGEGGGETMLCIHTKYIFFLTFSLDN